MKVASDFRLGGGLCGVHRFPPTVTTGSSHDLAAIEKVTKNTIPNSPRHDMAKVVKSDLKNPSHPVI